MLYRGKELTLRLLVTFGIARLFRFLNRKQALIVVYHGIVEGPGPPWYGVDVTMSELRWQLSYLDKHYDIRPLREVVDDTLSPRSPSLAAITFDDGFANNYDVAFPVLKERNVPATFFLGTGNVGTDSLSWPEEVYALLQDAQADSVDLSAHGMESWPLATQAQRDFASVTLLERLKRGPAAHKDAVLETLRAELGPLRPERTEQFRPLSWEQVHALKETGLVDFGSHGVSHDILTRLEPEAMAREIRTSCEVLRERLDTDRVNYAYPNGGPDDFDERAKEILMQEGAPCALTTIEGLNSPDEDRHALKRILVLANVSRARFALLCCGFIPWLRSILR